MAKTIRNRNQAASAGLNMAPPRGQDGIVSLAFLSGFMLAALLAGFAIIFLISAQNGDTQSFWISGFLFAALAVSSGLYIYRLAQRPAAPDSDSLLAAFDALPDASIVTDLEASPLYGNAAYRIYTMAADGVARSPLTLGATPDTVAQLAAAWRQARAGSEVDTELQLAWPDGQARFTRLTISRPAGDGGYLVWQFADLVSRVADGKALNTRQYLIGEALNKLGTGILLIDPAGKVETINRAMADWLGLSLGLSAGLSAGLAPEAAASGAPVPNLLTELTAFEDRTGAPRRIEMPDPRTGGRLGLYVSVVPLEAAPGLPSKGLIVLARRPERMAREPDASSSSDVWLEQFFNDAPVGIAMVDAKGRIKQCNRIFQALIPGYEMASEHSLQQLLPPEDLREVLGRLKSALKDEQKAPPIEIHFKGLPDATGQLYIHAISGEDDHPNAVLYLIDTTEQKNLEMQFAQSQKMQAVGQLAGGIAHDFNNLLTAISGFCDLLLVRHGPGDHSFEDIIQIRQNANRAANLVRQLLAFSRQQTLRPKVLVVTDVLAELSNLLRRLIGENIELRMTHGRDLGPVRVDQGQLEQVIINLVVNARDAMPDGGTLTIRTANLSIDESKKLGHEIMPPNNYVLIEVSDTGVGIPSENIGKIFEPFFSTKEVGKGTGLGLSTVYGIVKQTGGFIFPDSAPGVGATFRIYLPIHHMSEEAAKPQPAKAAPETVKDLTGKGTILLVEDEDAVRMFASRALRNKGYVVHEAASGEEALAIVERESEIDLLISDVVMPQMDGPSLVKEIRQRREGIKIIFISGYAEDAFRKNLGKTELFSFLPKPFSLKQLAGKVKDVLGAQDAG